MLDELGIEEGESEEFVLIQIHHEQLVSGCQIQLVGRELLVEVADVFAMFLRASAKAQKERYRDRKRERDRKTKKRMNKSNRRVRFFREIAHQFLESTLITESMFNQPKSNRKSNRMK